jgi:hypothetical protein
MFLTRTKADSRVLFFDNNTGADAQNVSDLDFDWKTGYRVGAILHRPGRYFDFEANFFSIDAWNATHSLRGSENQYGMNDLYGAGFTDIEDIDTMYGSDLRSAEFNLRHQQTCNLTWLVGFRYVELDERLAIRDVYNGTEESRTDAYNRLYGGQVGLDATLLRRDRLTVDAIGKAGIFANAASQDSSYTFFGTAAGDDETEVAFVGELEFAGLFQLTDHLSLRAAYELLWVSGAALAPDQIDVTDLNVPTAGIDVDGNVFYHGAVFGLVGTW